MKDYNVTWWNAETYPELNREWLGLIPEFFISATTEAGDGTLNTVADAMDEVYMYGGFRYPFSGTVDYEGIYRAPEDPPLEPYVAIQYLDKFTLYQYPYGIVALRDTDTGETKVGRFD